MNPKKIVFFCIPAHGHTNPTLGVVRELVDRGHQVLYYSYEMMRQKIEDAGAVFIPCDDYDMEMKLEPKDAVRLGSDLALSTRVLVETTLALDDMVCRDMEKLQPDCIVADSMAVWGKAVAMKLGIPFVSSTTTFAFNRHSSKIMPQSSGDLLRMLISMPKVNRQIRRLQKHGYPVRNILDIISNDDHTHTVVYTSEQVQPYGETFLKEYYAFVGPIVRDSQQSIDKNREKLVYISMGTVNNDMLPFYRSCICAFSQSAYQVILSVGNLVDIGALGYIPDHISVYPQVDQIAVLKEADVFITHCGMNSVSEALYYGVPMVMYPKTTEQKGVAVRTAQLGAGLMLEKEDSKTMLDAVNRVLTDSSFTENARRISGELKSCSGAAGAAEKILSCCR